MEIIFSSHFLKRAKSLGKKERDALDLRTAIFQNDSQDPRLRVHQLTGNLKGRFAFSITHSKRVVFVRGDKNNEVIFVDVGSHDEVY